MKKFLTFLCAVLTVLSVSAIERVESISLDSFSQWDDATYDNTTKILTPNKGWNGGSIWFGTKDATGYQQLVFELAEACQKNVQVEVQYNDYVEATTVTLNAGDTKVAADLAHTSLKSVVVKLASSDYEGVTIKMSSMYLYYKDSKIEKVNSVWTGSIEAGDWSGNKSLSADVFADCQAGDKIRVHVTALESDGQVALQDGSWHDFNPNVNYSFSSTDQAPMDVEFTLTEDMLTTISSKSGLIVKGKNFTMTEISLVNYVEPDYRDLDLSASMDYGWSSSYSTSNYTITFNADWATRGWSFSALDASLYDKLVCEFASKATSSGTVTINYNGTTVEEGFSAEAESVEVDLNAEKKNNITAVFFKYASAGDLQLSRVYLKKVTTPAPSAIEKDFSATGYASFSAPYAVTLPDGVKAGVAKVDGDKVVVTYVDTDVVPANTGVILKNEAKTTVSLQPTTDEVTASFENNDLVASCVTPEVPADGTYYCLLANEAAFQQVQNGLAVGANKAYLNANTATAARLMMVENSATAISHILVGEPVESATLSSQSNGKYISNGRLVIVKDGRMFNTAGQLVK